MLFSDRLSRLFYKTKHVELLTVSGHASTDSNYWNKKEFIVLLLDQKDLASTPKNTIFWVCLNIMARRFVFETSLPGPF